MSQNFFVTVEGEEVTSNLSKDAAVALAKKEYDKVKSTLSVGVGRFRYVKGVKVYTLLPLHFFTD
jgi:hypothetical protein